jgi:VanZ like protein
MRLAGIAAAVCLVVLVVTFGDLPGRWLFVGELQNSAHVPAFGAIAVLLLVFFRRWRASSNWSPLARYAAVLVIATAVGAAIEIIQGALHRDMSLEDVFHDFVGALVGAGVMHAFKWELSSTALRRTSMTLACAALLTAALPVVWSAAAYIHRDREFPVIVQFASALDRYFLFDCAARRDLARVENSQLLVTLQPDCHRQIGLGEPYSDWTGYTHLNVDIANTTSTETHFTIRIEDTQHNQEYWDRFNQTFVLAGNERKIMSIPIDSIRHAPKSRVMNMKEIYWMEIFASEDSTGGAVSLTRIWLD